MRSEYFIALAIFILCIFVGLSSALAGDWRSEFKSPDNRSCCGVEDCQQLARGFFFKIGQLIQLSDGTAATVTVIHPSPDGTVWFCPPTGCLFMPGTS